MGTEETTGKQKNFNAVKIFWLKNLQKYTQLAAIL